MVSALCSTKSIKISSRLNVAFKRTHFWRQATPSDTTTKNGPGDYAVSAACATDFVYSLDFTFWPATPLRQRCVFVCVCVFFLNRDTELLHIELSCVYSLFIPRTLCACVCGRACVICCLMRIRIVSRSIQQMNLLRAWNRSGLLTKGTGRLIYQTKKKTNVQLSFSCVCFFL